MKNCIQSIISVFNNPDIQVRLKWSSCGANGEARILIGKRDCGAKRRIGNRPFHFVSKANQNQAQITYGET